MKRILCWSAAAYIAGVFTARYIPIEFFFEITLITIFIFAVKSLFNNKKLLLQVLLLAACFLTGVGWYHTFESIQTGKVAQLIGNSCILYGRIVEQPAVKEQKTEYTVKVNQVIYDKKVLNTDFKIILICYNTEKDTIYNYGDYLRIKGTPEYPSQAFNAGDFDYLMYLRSKSIYTVCYAQKYQISKIADSQKKYSNLFDFAYYIRKFMMDTVDKYIPGNEAALLKGILVGDRADFTEEMKENFSDSGLSHLVAVSGSHVVVLLFAFAYIMQKLKLNKYIINLLGIGVVVLFMLITGCTPSVVRAGIMAIVALTAYLVNREADAMTSLFFSALLILLSNPLAIYDVGFQLSFSATASLLLFYKLIYDRFGFIPKSIREILSASIAAQIGTIPFTAYHFNNLSLVCLLSNIIAVPLTSVILISGMVLVVAACISGFLSSIAAGFNFVLLKVLLLWSGLCASLPFAVLRCPTPDIFLLIVYTAFVFILYKLLTDDRKRFIKVAGMLLGIFVFCLILIDGLIPKYLKVTFINVGQGDCILIHSPQNRKILIDGGGSSGTGNFDVGRKIVVPYLIRNGIMHLDAVIVSHFHDDHGEGVVSLLDEIDVDALIMPAREEQGELHKQLLQAAYDNRTAVHYTAKGDKIAIENGCTIDILSPDIESMNKKIYNENNASLVLKLLYGSNSFLFTSDIERETEKYLVETYGDSLDVDVLKVAHHGSDTSTGQEFLNKTLPEYAAISVGRNNFGHPSPEVLDRLARLNVMLYRTDINGTITFIADKERIKDVKVFREGVNIEH